jgi:hypothetical protein
MWLGGATNGQNLSMKCVSELQVVFGQRLGLDLTGKSVGEALAMIHDVIQCDFLGDCDLLGSSTPNRSNLLESFTVTYPG